MALLWVYYPFLVCVSAANGYSMSKEEGTNLTSYLIDGPIGKDSDVFRQLLNQETLIRMSLVKNVNSLMQDMVTLKQEMVSMKSTMDTMNTEIEELKRGNQRLMQENSELVKQLGVVNDTLDKIDVNISLMKNKYTEFEENFEQNRQNFERNISDILADIKIEVRYLSVTLLDLNQHTTEMKKNIPKLLDENSRTVLDKVNYTMGKFEVDLKDTNDRQLNLISSLSDMETFRANMTTLLSDKVNTAINALQRNVQQCMQNQTKLSLSVTTLELARSKEKVGFTVGISKSNSDWSGSILVFNTILYEVGGGYSTSTGKFTSPVDGYFVFYISVQAYKNKNIYLDIVLNNAHKVRAFTWQSGHNLFQTGTNMVFLKLQQGDAVWVQRSSGTGYYSSNPYITTFSGYLIFS